MEARVRFAGAILVSATIGVSAICAQGQGILIVQKETANGQSSTNQIQLDKTHMRAESKASGSPMAFVFDGQKQVAYMIDVSKKTYTELSKSDLEGMRGQMDAAMAQLQKQLESLPPQQRQMMEQMMRGRGGVPGAAAPQVPKVEYRPAGSDKVGQWSCTKYEGYVGQQKTTEVCTVDPKDLGLTPSDFDVARQFAEFMKTMAPQAVDRFPVNGGAQEGFNGIPVRRTSYRNGAVETVSELTQVSHQSFPASTFEPPSDYQKQAFGPAGRGGRGR
jgi:hypothetical protein